MVFGQLQFPLTFYYFASTHETADPCYWYFLAEYSAKYFIMSAPMIIWNADFFMNLL